MKRVIQHKKAMDVAFEVSNIRRLTSGFKIKGCWINLGYTGQPWVLLKDEIRIKNFDDWKDITGIYHSVIRDED